MSAWSCAHTGSDAGCPLVMQRRGPDSLASVSISSSAARHRHLTRSSSLSQGSRSTRTSRKRSPPLHSNGVVRSPTTGAAAHARWLRRTTRTGGERRKEWHYFVLDRRVGPCFLEPAGSRARWVRDLLADPRVRIIVDDGVYEGVARISADDAETGAVKELFRNKYGSNRDPAVDDLLAAGVAVIATDDPQAVARAVASTTND